MEDMLAVAMWAEDSLVVGSVHVKPWATAQEVADEINKTFSWGTPDQILLIANNNDGPLVWRHWSFGKDYK